METPLLREEKYVIYWTFLGCPREKFTKLTHDVVSS